MSFKEALMQSRVFTTGGEDAASPKTGESSVNPGSKKNGSDQETKSSYSLGTMRSMADSFSQATITHRFNGNNYLQWSRNILMYVRGKNKEKYLTGIPAPPKPESADFESWSAENNMVMAWLINSMTIELSENYLLASTAKEIWDSTRKIYSVKENMAAIIQVKRLLRNLPQEEQSVTSYYSALMKLWQRLDLYEDL